MVDIITGTAFDAPKRMHHREDEPALEFPSGAGSRSRGLLALRAQNWRASGGHKIVYGSETALWFEVEAGYTMTMPYQRTYVSGGKWLPCVINFGDGKTESIAYGSSVSHTYSAGGRYKVILGDDVRELRQNTWLNRLVQIENLNDKITSMQQAFDNNGKNVPNLVGKLPPWPRDCVNSFYCFRNCTGLVGFVDEVPESEYAPSRFTTTTGCVTGCSAEFRALFPSSWGGTKS